VSTRGPWIVSRTFDWLFFLGSPMLALSFGILVSGWPWAHETRWIGGESDTLVGFFIGTVIHAHLVAVLFRSHGNAQIRRLYPIRFFVVPAVVWLAIVASSWVAALSVVVATFWDVWHSGAQTFGFARIYERNHGTPPEVGRRLDFWLQQVLYAGPILAGATLMEHVESFDSFASVGDAFLGSVPAKVEGVRRYLTLAVVGAGTLLVVAYVVTYWRLARRGQWKPPWLKIWLVASTGFVSIYTWAFNSWGEAFLIMNLFHGVQYLALVWVTEGKRAGLVPFVGGCFAYGLGVQALDADLTALWAITIVVSLMHFWYDAFVWSVRKQQI
jgi:hypothetical protein